MGAEVFGSTAEGKDAKEAFGNAVEQAQYDYGHAGYTGTIAEKHGFVMVTDERLSYEAAEALARKLIDAEDPRVDDKWGDAGCIALDDGRFHFFGWASS